MNKTFALLLVLLFILSLGTFQPLTVKAQNKTIVVPQDYPTIQSAIGNASSSSIVYVKSGTYYESQLNITKSIKLFGENKNTTIIINTDQVNWDPTLHFAPPPFPKVIHVTADNVEISGFTFGCEYGHWSPIEIDANNAKAYSNIIGKTGTIMINGNNNNLFNNYFTEEVATPYIDCRGSNNSIASNFMIRDSEIANAYLNIKGESTLIYNNTMKKCIIEVSGYKNTIIKNNFTNCGLEINKDSFNCTISNQRIKFLSLMGFYNMIYENEITGMEIGGTHGSSDSANNSFYRNNFMMEPPEIRISTETPGYLIWDNGVVGNYWAGYHGLDTNKEGIGDFPYDVSAVYSSFNGAKRYEAIVPCGQDNYPLMHPIEIKEVSLEVPNATPTSSPSLDAHLKPLSSQTTRAVVVPIIIAVIIVLFALLFRRHRKTANLSK